jgi:hypothetical protein
MREISAVEPRAVAGRLRTPLHAMLGHVKLVAAKRLSDRGRQRLEQLEVQVRLLAQRLDGPAGPGTQGRVAMDPTVTVRQVISELDAVLTEEGSRLPAAAPSTSVRTQAPFPTLRA